MNAVTQHKNAKGERGDDGDIGNFAKVDKATHLFVAIEGNDDSYHEKHSTHRLVKEDAEGADQVVEGGLQKLKHVSADGVQKRQNNTTAVLDQGLLFTIASPKPQPNTIDLDRGTTTSQTSG